MKNKLATLVGALALSAAASAQTWIWYPGDYEIWLGNRMNNRRTERGAFFPPFWKTDSHYVVVEFSKKLDLAEPEEIFIAAEGKYNVKLDGKLQFGMPLHLETPRRKTQSEHQSVESVHSPHYLCERKNRKYGQDLESNLRRQGMDRRKRKSQ